MILASDVGGTKSLVGLFRRSGESLHEASYPSADYPSLEAILRDFLDRLPRRPRLRAAAVGVAGPVVDGRSHVVNLRWPVDGARLARALDLERARVRVLNDLEATGWGIPRLPARRLASLTPRVRAGQGNAALIAAGTGLGMALLVRDGDSFDPQPSEGGHQEFGPRDELEIELLRFLRRLHGRVSVERVVSGPAFSAIYRFLVESGWRRESARMAERLAGAADPNRAVSEAGLAGDDPIAEKAVDLFVSLYGSAAGDLALVAKATGGVFLGGGIAPKILPRLRSETFLRGFRGKGRMSPLLERIPVRVILEPRTALLGAAACGARLATRTTRTTRARRATPSAGKRRRTRKGTA